MKQLIEASASRQAVTFFGLNVSKAMGGKLEVKTTNEFFWLLALPTSVKALALASTPELQSLGDVEKENILPIIVGRQRWNGIT